MATSLDALEALLQFREGGRLKRPSAVHSYIIHHLAMPVPNPLDPAQPHVIEGDAPVSINQRQASDDEVNTTFCTKPVIKLSAASTVPNPLTPQPAISSDSALAAVCTQSKVVTHGFTMNSTTSSSPEAFRPVDTLSAEIRTEKIVDALNSKPQRGKKRRNLNELERQVLTRTRNREHARSTRMKKKARFQELLDIEQKYSLLQAKEALDSRRRDYLLEFVENIGDKTDCPHSTRLKELASQNILKPEFSALDTAAMTMENSGMARVTARGTDLESGDPKVMSGIICADFVPRTISICDVSLYWSPQNITERVGMFPSVSVLSFES